MARGDQYEASGRPATRNQFTYPIGPQGDWQQIIDNLATADNSGNSILNPDLVDGTHHHDFRPNGKGTTLLACVKYDDGHTAMVTSPVIQFFGKDHAGIWHKLKNASGSHELTLTCAPTTDLTDATNNYSDTVEIDMDGSEVVRAAIKTVFNGNGTDSLSYLLVKPK